MTPESRLILQQWLSSDYQLYNFFVSKLKEQLKVMGEKRVQQELNVLRKKNEKLKVDCNAHIVDNQSLKGTDLHMALDIVQAYNLTENCHLYAKAEPAFYNLIKKEQKLGPLKKHENI